MQSDACTPIPYHAPQLSDEERLAAAQQFLQTMSWRHSIHDFATTPVPYELIEQAPYVIVVFEQAYGINHTSNGQEQRIKHYYVRESVGIAVGFLLASLTHAGLATLTHTPSPMGFLATLLGRPSNERPYVLIPVGYPAEDATVPAITKKPLDQICIHLAAQD
ncbi:MAG: hypothetical protein Fur005_13010 [Roseiflexaceae bacterium]